MSKGCVRIAAVAAAFVLAAPLAHGASEQPVELNWAQLIPAAKPQARPLKNLFAGAQPGGDNGAAALANLPEGKWMATPRKPSDTPPELVTALDGKRVHIGGYVVPLDFESTTVKEFLLVPFVGACIHVPPPPANQIIYVKSERGFDVNGSFDPVYVTGVLKASVTFTGLAETGYSIEAEKVELRK